MVIREATIENSAGIAKVGVDTWRATYRGIMADGYLDGLSYERSTHAWQHRLTEHPAFTYVALTDIGEIIGYAHAGPERDGEPGYTGELYALYVLQEHQGNGAGKALLQRVARKFAGDGVKGMIIWVLSANPCRGFYEHIGGRFLRAKVVNIGGRDLEESAYGWEV